MHRETESLEVTPQMKNMAGEWPGLLGCAPSSSSCCFCGPHCLQEAAEVGWGRGGSHPGPARSKLQGHGLQVHIPEAVSLLWQVSTKDPQIREYKEHSVKAVTSGPGSHKTNSPQQVFPSQLPSVPPPHSQPPSCPGSTPDVNRGSGKSLETPFPSPQSVPLSEEYSGMSRVLLGRDHV